MQRGPSQEQREEAGKKSATRRAAKKLTAAELAAEKADDPVPFEDFTPGRFSGAAQAKHEKEEKEEFIKSGMDNPLVAAKAEEIRLRTEQDILDPKQTQRWEQASRKSAEQQKNAILARARSLGLNASQMGALQQGLQEADVQFEKQIYKMREEDRESAKEEHKDFLMAARERGTSALIAQQALQLQKDQAAAANSTAMFGSILSFIGSALGTAATIGAWSSGIPVPPPSDERIKSNIDRKRTGPAAYDFLENLDVAQYNMPGVNTPEMGVMAQSMEKSPLGQQAVTEVEGVKSIDIPQAFKALIVAQKEMHDRVKRLETV